MPIHDKTGSSGGTPPVPPAPVTLQRAYNNGASDGTAGVIQETDAKGSLILGRGATNPVVLEGSAPPDAVAGTSLPVEIDLFSQGHTSPGEGGGGGIPTSLLMQLIAQSSGGAMSGIAALVMLFINSQLAAQWSPDCANGETLMFVVEKTGGVFTARRVVRDPATGVLSAP
jgi:hypothetical protein